METNKMKDINAEDAMKMSEEEFKKTQAKLRKQMQDNFGKWLNVYDEEASKEDIQAAKDEFDAECKKYADKEFTIIDKDGLPFVELLIEWNKKYNRWEKGQWKGVIMFDKVMNEVHADLKAHPEKPLVVDYSTLMYLYQAMSNPCGVGLKEAKAMADFENFDPVTAEPKKEDSFVTYSHILQNVYNHVVDLANLDKKLSLMRERINIMASGIKFDWKITELEEFIELYDFWIGEGLPSDAELEKM